MSFSLLLVENNKLITVAKHNTHTIQFGSFLLLTITPDSHFSFFLFGKVVLTCLWPACVGRISHHGQSVSIINLSAGIEAATAKFSAVLRELLERNGMTYKNDDNAFSPYIKGHIYWSMNISTLKHPLLLLMIQ